MTDQADAQFGSPDCTCIPWTRQGGTPRYLNRPTDTVDMIGGWERRRDCPHHAPAPAPELREQYAAAVEEAIWSADNGSFHQVDVDQIRTAVLAVPAIQQLQAAVEQVRKLADEYAASDPKWRPLAVHTARVLHAALGDQPPATRDR